MGRATGSSRLPRSPREPTNRQNPPQRPADPADPRRDPFDDPAWLFEPKYDGYRGLLYVTRKGCHFRSKRGNVLKRFQELCYWVRAALPVKEAILDGEVVTLNSEGWQNFRDLLAGLGNLHYAAFDALWINGRDLRRLPLTRRKRALHRLVPATTTVLSQVFSIEERGCDMFTAAQRIDLEGDVAKGKVDPYASGTVWYKIKNRANSQMEGETSSPTGDSVILRIRVLPQLSGATAKGAVPLYLARKRTFADTAIKGNVESRSRLFERFF